jgi:hypothetical protein
MSNGFDAILMFQEARTFCDEKKHTLGMFHIDAIGKYHATCTECDAKIFVVVEPKENEKHYSGDALMNQCQKRVKIRKNKNITA